VESVQTRFRPIMMTSLSTIVGMIPLAAEWALGAERFSPLATAVIGGMITATLLTLIVIPALYDLIDDAGARVTRLLQRVRARPAAAGRSS
jgi:multidrug efflux pump subunit AcrB